MIFICGPSRSGTALLRSALNRHPDVHITGETHYFDDLRVRLRSSLTRPLQADEIPEVTRYFSALSHRPYGHGGDPASGRIGESELIEHAEANGHRLDDYFLAYCQLEAKQHGKRLVGEKTPRHIFRIDDMLSVFPDARVLCLTRDPRSVVASYKNWRNQGGFDFHADPSHRDELAKDERRAAQSYHPATIALLWRAQMNAALNARSRHGDESIHIVRYEDLVHRPADILQEIALWLGISYETTMLEVPMHNSSFSSYSDSAGISRDALYRWKSTLDPSEIQLVNRICSSGMHRLGYSTETDSRHAVGELILWAYWPVSILKAVYYNRHRTGNIGGYILRRLRLAFRK